MGSPQRQADKSPGSPVDGLAPVDVMCSTVDGMPATAESQACSFSLPSAASFVSDVSSSPGSPASVESKSAGSCSSSSQGLTESLSSSSSGAADVVRTPHGGTEGSSAQNKRKAHLRYLKLGSKGSARLLADNYLIDLPRGAGDLVRASIGHRWKPCFAVTGLSMVGSAAAVRDVSNRAGTGELFDHIRLSPDGQRIRDTPNAGGASVRSEVMSFELLRRAFKAELKATETEVWYWPKNGPITDYVCEIVGETIGVSVTRAFSYKGVLGPADASRLLRKKLQGVINSSKTVLYPEFTRQILHVWCEDAAAAAQLRRAYAGLQCCYKSNTVVLVTVASAASWIFDEKAHSSRLAKKKTPAAKKKTPDENNPAAAAGVRPTARRRKFEKRCAARRANRVWHRRLYWLVVADVLRPAAAFVDASAAAGIRRFKLIWDWFTNRRPAPPGPEGGVALLVSDV
ncbi:hypothetical protein DIPPA_02123 [Diplonema papillatum]|nr:hypothetical protein DIPPA_02123 [Diplonema papillatum]